MIIEEENSTCSTDGANGDYRDTIKIGNGAGEFDGQGFGRGRKDGGGNELGSGFGFGYTRGFKNKYESEKIIPKN